MHPDEKTFNRLRRTPLRRLPEATPHELRDALRWADMTIESLRVQRQGLWLALALDGTRAYGPFPTEEDARGWMLRRGYKLTVIPLNGDV